MTTAAPGYGELDEPGQRLCAARSASGDRLH
ncbi:uncharacterized protein METZ01_LOCUS178175 [marine metagenome]|uniref:Uncharacterized protein n=1 Tax=marine metagenome TaxID=408172 RepID=A0A382CI72_9ZZZZ